MSETLSRAQRLARLPSSRQHGKLLLGSGIGWALDAMDVGLISFVMAALAAQWKLDATTPLASPEWTPSRSTSTRSVPPSRPRSEVVIQSWS